MKTQQDIDLILVKLCGTAILTVALIRLPGVFKSLAQLFTTLVVIIQDDSGNLFSGMTKSFAGAAAAEIVAFGVLVLVARWVFRYPPFIRGLFEGTNRAGGSGE